MNQSERNSRYYAFISYRHKKLDRKWAKWLHYSIETYHVPKRLVLERNLPSQIRPLFRDEEEFAALPNLSIGIEEALKQSRFLIVVCSPNTPKSEWVNKEILRFRELERNQQIFSLLIDGEPYNSFPRALREIRREIVDDGDKNLEKIEIIEPLAADVRPIGDESMRYRKRMALLRIIAAILDCDFDELRQRDQERRTRNLIFTGFALALLSAGLFALSMYALYQRDESRQRLVRVTMANGLQTTDRGDWIGALPWFADAFKLDQATASKELIHRMRLASFSRQSPKLVQVLFHEGAVNSVVFDSEGSRIITASSDKTARVWNVQSGSPISPPLTIPGNVMSVADATFSSDGRWIAAVFSMGLTDTNERQKDIVQIWDTRNWQPATPIRHDIGANTRGQLAFSPDGLRIITGGYKARTWNALTGEPISEPISHGTETRIESVAFSSDGKRILTAGSDGNARVWDPSTGKPLSPLMSHKYMIDNGDNLNALTHAEFSKDGRKILTVSLGGTARVWDISGHPITPWLNHIDETGAFQIVLHGTFSNDGQRAATGAKDGSIRVWDANTGKLISQTERAPKGKRNFLHYVAFSPDGNQIISASEDKVARLWEAGTGLPVSSLMLHGDVVNYVAFSPDGKLFITAGEDGVVRIWKVPEVRNISILQNPIDKEQWLVATRFSPDGKRLATLKRDGTLQLWNTETWQSEPIQTNLDGSDDTEIIWGHEFIIVSGTPQGAGMWNLQSKQQITLPDNVKFIRALSKDERGIVVQEPDGTGIQVLDRISWKPISDIIRHSDTVYSVPGNTELVPDHIIYVAFSSDGKRIVTVNYGSTVRVWNAATGEPITPAIKHMSPTTSDDEITTGVPDAEFSPDGKLVITSSADRTARIWDTVNGHPVSAPLQHDLAVRRALFNRDGQLVATISSNGSARVWDAATGEAITPPLMHDTGIKDVAFCESGNCLMTVSENHSVRVWDLTPEDQSLQRISLYSQAASFRHIDDARGFVPLQINELKGIWNQLH